MANLIDAIPQLSRTEGPWPRALVDEASWRDVARDLGAGRWTMLSLWAEQGAVHLALFDEQSGGIGIVSHECGLKRFPSVGASHPPAIRDLYGLDPVGLWDLRPWLDFGVWDVMQPLGPHPDEAPWTAPFVFLPV